MSEPRMFVLYGEGFEAWINLDQVTHNGERYHKCRACGAEWEAEKPDGPANPNWWRCRYGCNAEAGAITPRMVRLPELP